MFEANLQDNRHISHSRSCSHSPVTYFMAGKETVAKGRLTVGTCY